MAPSWRRAPFLRIGLCFVPGCMAGLYVRDAEWNTGLDLLPLTGACLTALAALRPWSFHRRYIPGILLAAALIQLGYLHGRLSSPLRHQAHHFRHDSADALLCRIITTGKSDTLRTRLRAEALGQISKGHWTPVSGITAITLHRCADTLLPGDLVALAASPVVPPNPRYPYGFNYGGYLRSQGVYTTCTAYPGRFAVVHDPIPSFDRLLHRWRVQLEAMIARHVTDEGARGILYALLLGDTRELDQELQQAYTQSGTVHILAVSGLHVGMIYLVISALFGKFLLQKRWPLLRALVQALLLWMYAGLTGFSPSVCRSAVMCTFFIVAGTLGRQSNSINTLFASAMVQVVHDPLALLSAGFQLSYLAVLGILTLQAPLERLIFFPNRLLRAGWKLSAVSLAAQLGTLPLTLWMFGQFPVYFLLANLILIPLSSLLLYLGVLFLATGWWDVSGRWLGWALETGVQAMNAAARGIGNLPGAVWKGCQPGPADALFLACCIICAGCWIARIQAIWLVRLTAVVVVWNVVAAIGDIARPPAAEVLISDTRSGLTIIHSTPRGSLVWTEDTLSVMQSGHPLEAYLRRRPGPVMQGRLVLPDSAAWISYLPPQSMDTITIALDQVNKHYLKPDAWIQAPGRNRALASGIARRKAAFLTRTAEQAGQPLIALREACAVYRGGAWASSWQAFPE